MFNYAAWRHGRDRRFQNLRRRADTALRQPGAPLAELREPHVRIRLGHLDRLLMRRPQSQKDCACAVAMAIRVPSGYILDLARFVDYSAYVLEVRCHYTLQMRGEHKLPVEYQSSRVLVHIGLV